MVPTDCRNLTCTLLSLKRDENSAPSYSAVSTCFSALSAWRGHFCGCQARLLSTSKPIQLSPAIDGGLDLETLSTEADRPATLSSGGNATFCWVKPCLATTGLESHAAASCSSPLKQCLMNSPLPSLQIVLLLQQPLLRYLLIYALPAGHRNVAARQ